MRADLLALIDYTGLSMREAASVIGIGHEALSRKLAGRERYDVLPREVEALRAVAEMQDRVVERSIQLFRVKLDQAVEAGDADYDGADAAMTIVIYRRDEDILPAAGIPFASAHRMTAARIAREVPAELVMFDAEQYGDWLGIREDTQEARAEWAATVERRRVGIKMDWKASGFQIGWAVLRLRTRGRVTGHGTENISN